MLTGMLMHGLTPCIYHQNAVFRQLAKPMFLLTPGSHMTQLLLDKSGEVLDPAHLGSQFTKRHPQLFTHIMYNYDIYILPYCDPFQLTALKDQPHPHPCWGAGRPWSSGGGHGFCAVPGSLQAASASASCCCRCCETFSKHRVWSACGSLQIDASAVACDL